MQYTDILIPAIYVMDKKVYILEQVTKAQRGSRGMALLFL
jgi:hypothetical protein